MAGLPLVCKAARRGLAVDPLPHGPQGLRKHRHCSLLNTSEAMMLTMELAGRLGFRARARPRHGRLAAGWRRARACANEQSVGSLGFSAEQGGRSGARLAAGAERVGVDDCRLAGRQRLGGINRHRQCTSDRSGGHDLAGADGGLAGRRARHVRRERGRWISTRA